jgi:hypothetical protein
MQKEKAIPIRHEFPPITREDLEKFFQDMGKILEECHEVLDPSTPAAKAAETRLREIRVGKDVCR